MKFTYFSDGYVYTGRHHTWFPVASAVAVYFLWPIEFFTGWTIEVTELSWYSILTVPKTAASWFRNHYYS